MQRIVLALAFLMGTTGIRYSWDGFRFHALT